MKYLKSQGDVDLCDATSNDACILTGRVANGKAIRGSDVAVCQATLASWMIQSCIALGALQCGLGAIATRTKANRVSDSTISISRRC